MPTVTFLPSRKRLVLTLLGALAFVVLTGAMAIFQPTILTVLLAVVAVPFFGWAGALTVVRLGRRGPELIITDDGFKHRQLGWISWREVAVVIPRQMQTGASTQRFIEVVLHDPQAYLKQRPQSARLLGRGNMGLGYSPVTISANTLPNSIGEVLAAMQQRHERFLTAAAVPPPMSD